MSLNFNLKAVASAVASLALTVVLSWTFVDATKLVRVAPDAGPDFVASVSALVR